ncbi:RNA polymerase sigma factor [Gilvimarinus polysaccharolyticus]|uniref:RNA polymerase sigma factor n=1 Tax=Gilvimarinus polysaccharolyticus TaxID=863921 RepID=UPI00067358DC|nr:sigma-70 family RNA polymerase sigma factor [Gilvimarinus polysaccharolyticus]
MSLFKKRIQPKDLADTDLVLASLGGNHDAFGEVVSRYQSLLCSLAYAAVGDIKHSEDIAQEAFVEAWRKLDTLREPEKLKSWLCGILRFKVSRYRRTAASQPTEQAGEIIEQTAEQTSIDDAAIQEQQQALLWQTLEKLPDTYREPLILFYREQRSVEHVACELELSEDAVKQRLSRGRKVLQQAMLSFVEDALEKTKPGAAFTLAVLVSISSVTAPKAKAAAFSAGAAQTGTLFKWASLLTVAASFSGVIGSFFSVRASLALSRTQRERRAVIKIVALYFLAAAVYVASLFLLKYAALASATYRDIYALGSQLIVLGFIAAYLLLLRYMLTSQPRLRAQERLRLPQAFNHPHDQAGAQRREYKSRLSLFGVPFIHFKLGMPEMGDKPALGWIAGGDKAYGLVFAWGGLAVAPISVGIVSIGLVTVGALGLGLMAAGTVAVGVIGFGASAIAYKAYGSLSALGWESAFSGGFAIAKEAAIAPLPFAKFVNNEQASRIVNLTALDQNYLWVLGAITVLVIVPAVWHSNKVRSSMAANIKP